MNGRATGVGLALGQPGVPLRAAVGLARDADRAGARVLGVGDGFTESFSMLGALATATSSARLMTTVATWTRTPVTTAAGVAALQELSGGRVALGIGPMPKQWSEDWHGVDHSRPIGRMRDFVAAVRAVHDAAPDATVDHDGPYYRVRGYRRLAPPTGHPLKVVLAATGTSMTRLAGEIADGVLLNTMCSPEWARHRSLPALAEGVSTAARSIDDVERAALVYCSVDDDEGAALDRARAGLSFYFQVPYFADVLEWHGFDRELAEGRAALAAGDGAAAAAAVSDDMVRRLTLAGTPAQVLDRARDYADVLDWIELSPPVDVDPGATVVMLERIVELIPALNAIFDDSTDTDRPGRTT